MKNLKGIVLVGTYAERQEQINNYIGELGGKKVRRRRNPFTQELELEFSGKRQGACNRDDSKDHTRWDEQPCFGYKTSDEIARWFGKAVGYVEENRVFMKCHWKYDEVVHYTLVDCQESCFKKAIVVCVRELRKSGERIMTAHVAGECPYCTYHLNY